MKGGFGGRLPAVVDGEVPEGREAVRDVADGEGGGLVEDQAAAAAGGVVPRQEHDAAVQRRLLLGRRRHLGVRGRPGGRAARAGGGAA